MQFTYKAANITCLQWLLFLYYILYFLYFLFGKYVFKPKDSGFSESFGLKELMLQPQTLYITATVLSITDDRCANNLIPLTGYAGSRKDRQLLQR